MSESAFPRNRERFIDLRVAVQNERHQLCGMIEGGLMSPCHFLRFPSLPFGYHGCHAFLETREPPTAYKVHFSSFGLRDASMASMRHQRSQTSMAREYPESMWAT